MSVTPIIRAESHLFGIRFWAQWYQAPLVPRYDVYEYVGQQPTIGMFWFQSRRHKHMMARRFVDLNRDGFRPFLLNIDRSASWLETGGI